MAKKILISGLAGFTGFYLSKEFTNNGWEVYGFGSESKNLPNYYQADLLNYESLLEVINKVQPDAVAHLAGIAYAAHHSAIELYNTHVTGTHNLLQALVDSKVPIQKILLASSANVYGNTSEGYFSEDAPLKPFNDYGVSKLAMEYMAWLWRDKLPIVIARPFNYTGVGQSLNFLIPKIVQHYQDKKESIELGNLHPQRDYSDVRSVASAYRQLIECSESKGAVNICSGTAHSVSEIVEIMNTISGYKINVKVNPAFIRPDEVELLVGSRKNLESYIGVHQWFTLEDTLKWMYKASR